MSYSHRGFEKETTMARPREFDIDEALSAATAAFKERGFEATSLTDLMDATGLHKGSLYKAFGSKHELFQKALERYLSNMCATMQKTLEEPRSAKEGIRRWLNLILDSCSGKDAQRGCLAVNSIVELGPHDQIIAKRLTDHFNRVEKLLAQTIARGQEHRELRDDRSSLELAEALFMMAKGMLATSKGMHSKARMKRFADFALETLT